MNWFIWAVLSAFFAGLTAVLAKVGVENVNSNLATAIRTVRDSNLRLVGCRFYEEPATLDDWETNLGFSDPLWHCYRLILAMLFSSTATR